MKYRVIKKDEELTIILADGGIACIRDVDDDSSGRQSTTDYYQSRFTQEMLDNNKNIWEEVGKGKMYYNDWTTPFDDPKHIEDALEWLCCDCNEFELDESIWEYFTNDN